MPTHRIREGLELAMSWYRRILRPPAVLPKPVAASSLMESFVAAG
jgi:hypothetical protein